MMLSFEPFRFPLSFMWETRLRSERTQGVRTQASAYFYTVAFHVLDIQQWDVDKTRDMEHSGTSRNILENPGTSRNYNYENNIQER